MDLFQVAKEGRAVERKEEAQQSMGTTIEFRWQEGEAGRGGF